MTNSCPLPDEFSQRELQKLEEAYLAVFGEEADNPSHTHHSDAEAMAAIEREIAGLGSLANLSEAQAAAMDRHQVVNELIQILEEALRLVKALQSS